MDEQTIDEQAMDEQRGRRVVLVTGGAGGVGRALCTAFAAQGDQVVIHYGSSRDAAEELGESLPGDGHVALAADLRDPEALLGLLREATEQAGPVDVLVNNAAALVDAHAVSDTDYEQWQQAWTETIAVNLMGPANLSYLVARQMIDRGAPGSIVNVGSRGAFRGEPDHPAYGASKAGLHALGQSLAVSLGGHGISVSTVAPGFIATERVAGRLSGAEGEAITAQSPFGRVAEPEEVAAAVIYLASSAAQWATGAILDLNGASHLRS